MLKLAICYLCVIFVGNSLGALNGFQDVRMNSQIQCPFDAFFTDIKAQLNKIESEQKIMQENILALQRQQESQMVETQIALDAHLHAVQTELENPTCQNATTRKDIEKELLVFQNKIVDRVDLTNTILYENTKFLEVVQRSVQRQTDLQNSLNSIIAKQDHAKSSKQSISKDELEMLLKEFEVNLEAKFLAVAKIINILDIFH